MTRGWNASFASEMRSADPKPVLCLAIRTGIGSTIRITNNEVDLVFPAASGTTYFARPLQHGEMTVGGADPAGFTLVLGDADGFWDSWLAATDFRFQRVTRILAERDSLDSAAKAHVDQLRVRSVDRTDREVKLNLEPLQAILADVRIPKNTINRELFPGIPESQDSWV